MGPDPLSERRRSRLPALAFAGLAVPAAVLGLSRLLGEKALTEGDALGLALSRGLVPVEERLAKGIEVFQWDPELARFPPLFIGTVTDPRVVAKGGDRYARIKSPNRVLNGTCLAIHPGEMRYWARR